MVKWFMDVLKITNGPKWIKKVLWWHMLYQQWTCLFLPWYPSSLHFVGHSDVCGPDIVLPAFLTQHSSQHCAAVHSDPHVNICLGFLSDIPVVSLQSSNEKQQEPQQASIRLPEIHPLWYTASHLEQQGTPSCTLMCWITTNLSSVTSDCQQVFSSLYFTVVVHRESQ